MTATKPTALALVSAFTDAEAATAAAPFLVLRDALRGSLLERDAEVDGILTAMVAGEHVLLLGPPGTAKSMLATSIAKALTGSRYFERLMTPFSLPEELFGPTSIAGLRADRFERVTDGFLPAADVAFLDEIFKANSSILNSLLTLINERKFDNGTKRLDCPLKLMIGASNELPEQDAALDALYDRFVSRFWVRSTSDRASKRALLRMRGGAAITATITEADLAIARAAVDRVRVSEEVEDAIIDCVEVLSRECGIDISDRRLRKVGALIRARALLAGRTDAIVEDVMVLADAAWRRPDDIAPVLGAITRAIAPSLAEALKLLDAATEARATIDMTKGLSPDQVGAAANIQRQIKDMARAVRILPAGPGTDRIERVAVQIDGLSAELTKAVADSFRNR